MDGQLLRHKEWLMPPSRTLNTYAYILVNNSKNEERNVIAV